MKQIMAFFYRKTSGVLWLFNGYFALLGALVTLSVMKAFVPMVVAFAIMFLKWQRERSRFLFIK